MINDVMEKTKQLQLRGMAPCLEQAVTAASEANWNYTQFLEHLLDIELDVRRQKRIKARTQQAKLPQKPTLDEFEFDFHASRQSLRGSFLKLMQLDFIGQQTDVILIGNPGVGKTHLACCLGYAAAQAAIRTLFTTATEMINQLTAAEADHSLVKKMKTYQEPDLLICDEIGYLPLKAQGSNLFFQVISARHQRKSTILTTNLPFAKWGTIFDNTTVATAIADRLVYNSEILILEGESYRRAKRK